MLGSGDSTACVKVTKSIASATYKLIRTVQYFLNDSFNLWRKTIEGMKQNFGK